MPATRRPPTGDLPAKWQRRFLGSDFLGQKGLAMLRAGQGDDSQGLFLRYGPSLNHGHFDDLNVNYIARGYDVTYDMGYGRSAATQTQHNWARQTVSHNVVVVDEASQLETGETGGSLELFAESPLVRAVEASSNRCYAKQGVSQYRRLAALIGGEGESAYLLDIFRVRGGRQHDYVFHALGDVLRVGGLTLGPAEPGSLAGPGHRLERRPDRRRRHRRAPQQLELGRSPGERLRLPFRAAPRRGPPGRGSPSGRSTPSRG